MNTLTILANCENMCGNKNINNPCEITEWYYVTVIGYRKYHQAFHWLRQVRNHKHVFVDGLMDEHGYTGEYRFKFLCKNEYFLFNMMWS